MSPDILPALIGQDALHVAASNDTISELAQALRRHVDAVTLEKVLSELL